MEIPKKEQVIKCFYKDDELRKPLFALKSIEMIVKELEEMGLKIPSNIYEYMVWRNNLYQVIYDIKDKELEENGRIFVCVSLGKKGKVYGFTKHNGVLAINLYTIKKRMLNAEKRFNKHKMLTESQIGIKKIKRFKEEMKRIEKEDK